MSVEELQLERRKLLFVLEDIVRKCELDALAVVTQRDAEEIAFFTEIDINSDIFCTIAAATLDTATKVTNKLNHGSVTELIVIGDKGFTIMSPIGSEFILIGAGRDFYSMGKTILILREKVKYIPLSLITNSNNSKRKACSHFCRNDGLYCCICANKTDICELCVNSVKHKQNQAEKQKAAFNKSKKETIKVSKPRPEISIPIPSENELIKESEHLIGKVIQKIDDKSKVTISKKKTKKSVKKSKKSRKQTKKVSKKTNKKKSRKKKRKKR